MKRLLVSSLWCLMLSLTWAIAPPPVMAQTQSPQLVTPVHLYRFRVSNTKLGYLLTHDYHEGAVLGGLTYDGTVGGIYRPPAAGWTPDPAAGLVALHRWLVVESGYRKYYYYSIYFAPHGSNYFYEGIQGYVYPPGHTSQSYSSGATYQPVQVSAWYSQSYGYWYGTGGVGYGSFAPPPNNTYANHGVIFAEAAPWRSFSCGDPSCPTSVCGQPFTCTNFGSPYDVYFYAPPEPPPPPTCDPDQEQACYYQGGWWDYNTCSCQYW